MCVYLVLKKRHARLSIDIGAHRRFGNPGHEAVPVRTQPVITILISIINYPLHNFIASFIVA